MTTPLEELLLRHIEAGTIPGAVALLASSGDVEMVAAGLAGVGGEPLRDDAIMRIQSMTKVITSVAALRLVEAGRLGLDDSVAEWLPELASRRVLRHPAAALDDTVPARRPITLRHLLTNTSGYGMATTDSPWQQAMVLNGTEAGPEPVSLGADEWLTRLADLPLAFQPGEGWRYHHSFGILGILLARLTGRPLGEHLANDLFDRLGMADTAYWCRSTSSIGCRRRTAMGRRGSSRPSPPAVASMPAHRPSTSATPNWSVRRATITASSGCSSTAVASTESR